MGKKRPIDHGLFMPNLPKEYWGKLKALKEHHGLSTRQTVALGIRAVLVMGQREPDLLEGLIDAIKVEVSTKPGPRAKPKPPTDETPY